MDSLLKCIAGIENIEEASFESLFYLKERVLKYGSQNPYESVKRAIFDEGGFVYAKTGQGLPAFFKNKQGDCLDFALTFYFLLGYSGFHTELLAVPEHTIVRFFEDGKGRLVEATDGSIESPEFYISSRKIHEDSIISKVYLSPLDNNQILAVYLNNRTRCYIQNKDYAQALNLLQEAYCYSAVIPELHYNLGYVYRQKNELEAAKKYFSEAIRLHPNFSKSYNEFGICHALEGNTELAEICFLKSLSLVPSDEAKANLLSIRGKDL